MLAFGSYVGFEATAIYAERCRDPEREIPRATYGAIAFITLFYGMTTWAALSAYGSDAKAVTAAKDHTDTFIFDAATQFAGSTISDLMQLLVLTSLFASLLAFHQGAARYVQALSFGGLLPNSLQEANEHGAPEAASRMQITVIAVVAACFIVAGQDPYLGLGASTFGVGVLGMVVLQATASAAAVAFFWRRGHRRGFTTIIAPAIAAVTLSVACVLMVGNFQLLTNSHVAWINDSPVVLAIAALGGLVMAAWMRRARPDTYQLLAFEAPEPEPEPELSAAAA
jgi:amino acid transporter